MHLATKSNARKAIFGALLTLMLMPLRPALAVPVHTSAARELGQPDFVHNVANLPDSNVMNRPEFVTVDTAVTPNQLFIADEANSRILVYTSELTLANGGPATFVVGQPDFTTGSCNFGGITATSLCTPQQMAIDGSGNLWVADFQNSRVLEYAGYGSDPDASFPAAALVLGQGGDFTSDSCNLSNGSDPTAETLCDPVGVGIDSFGNVYVADQGNQRILEYNTPLKTTAIAGSGDTTADLVFGQAGSFTTRTGNNGGVSATSLSNPDGIAFDSANHMYVADQFNHRVLEFAEGANPPTVTTATVVFGQGGSFTTGSCNKTGVNALGLCNPVGVRLDSSGDLYVADDSNNRVLEFNTPLTNQTANLVFGQNGNFTADQANLGNASFSSASSLFSPTDVALDGQTPNHLYVADLNNDRVLVFSTPLTSQTANIVLGQSDFLHRVENFVDSTTLNRPDGVAVDGSVTPNRLYVSDQDNNRVLAYASAQSFANGEAAELVIGQPDLFGSNCNFNGVTASSLCIPAGMTVDSTGNVYVTDFDNNRVLEYNTPFTVTSTPGSGDTIADNVFGQGGDFFTNSANLGGSPDANTLSSPEGVRLDQSGNLWIADQSNHRVLEYNNPPNNTTANFVLGQGGSFLTNTCNKGGVSATSLCNPTGVVSDGVGNIYVSDFSNSRVLEYNTPLNPLSGEMGAGDATADLEFGQGNGSGTDFTHNSCNSSGVGATELCEPEDVAVDNLSNLYIADNLNSRVLEYNTPLTGPNTTANRVFGQSDDLNTGSCNLGGQLPSADTLCRPDVIAVDSTGDLFVADTSNNRVLEYDPPHLTPRRVNLGRVVDGSNSTKTIELDNTQGTFLNNINPGISGSGAFTIASSTCGSSIGPRVKCTITIKFAPSSKGSQTATLKVSDDAVNNPQSAELFGIGS